YRFDMFFAERHTTQSTLQIGTSIVFDEPQGNVVKYVLDAVDPDSDELFYELIGGPDGAVLSGRELWWYTEEPGTYDFEVEVNDGRGGIDRQVFSIEVEQEYVNAE